MDELTKTGFLHFKQVINMFPLGARTLRIHPRIGEIIAPDRQKTQLQCKFYTDTD